MDLSTTLRFCPREEDLIEGGGKADDTEWTFIPYVIDKESRRTIHAASYATNEVALHFIGIGARREGITQRNMRKP